MILSCQNLAKAFGENTVFHNVSFQIEEGEKVALVGNNGAGKTTLFHLLLKEMQPDEGIVAQKRDLTIGFLAQHQDYASTLSVYEDLLSAKQNLVLMEEQLRVLETQMDTLNSEDKAQLHLQEYHTLLHTFEILGGYTYKSEITGILNGLGFRKEDYQKSVISLSGGERTRLSLGRILLNRPDLILLDEPTNYLDIESVSWLETYLCNCKSALLLISHDRYFMNKIVSKVIEIENREVLIFSGNYDSFAAKKAELRAAQYLAYQNQQREVRHQEEVITRLKSFNREKSIRRAESHEKMLKRIERLDKPVDAEAEMRLDLEPLSLSGNDVLSVNGIKKSYGDRTLFDQLSFEIKRGEHVALLGKNGTGKTNILKIINQVLPADCGEVKLGSNVVIGYFDQQSQVLDETKSMFDEISDTYPKLTNTQIRNVLAAFLFTGDTVFRQISTLSGGERGRVVLAKLMLSGANFLILDEPTNHLDMTSKEILENALSSFTGTILYVSHDRYFINKTADRILVLNDGFLTSYNGNYDFYLEKSQFYLKETLSLNGTSPKSVSDISIPASKLDWNKQKELSSVKRKLENAIAKTEKDIEEQETLSALVDKELSLPENATNSVKLQELCNKQTEIQQALNLLYEKWESLNQESSSMEENK